MGFTKVGVRVSFTTLYQLPKWPIFAGAPLVGGLLSVTYKYKSCLVAIFVRIVDHADFPKGVVVSKTKA